MLNIWATAFSGVSLVVGPRCVVVVARRIGAHEAKVALSRIGRAQADVCSPAPHGPLWTNLEARSFSGAFVFCPAKTSFQVPSGQKSEKRNLPTTRIAVPTDIPIRCSRTASRFPANIDPLCNIGDAIATWQNDNSHFHRV